MTKAKAARAFHILVATDGSASAQAAVAAAHHFPWPNATRMRAVVVRHFVPTNFEPSIDAALAKSAQTIADDAQFDLQSRWPDATATVANGSPVESVLAEAERFEADIIIVGWRGHGPIRRLLAGSVSRNLVRRATCSVLVVRKKQNRLREIVIGFDGSPKSRRAIALVANLAVPKGGRVTIVRSVERIGVQSQVLVAAGTRAIVAQEIRQLNIERLAKGRAEARLAAATLESAGWDVRIVVTNGEPLNDLLTEVEELQSGLLVVGARGTSGIRQLLLGSVADGAVNRSPVSVLIAR